MHVVGDDPEVRGRHAQVKEEVAFNAQIVRVGLFVELVEAVDGHLVAVSCARVRDEALVEWVIVGRK